MLPGKKGIALAEADWDTVKGAMARATAAAEANDMAFSVALSGRWVAGPAVGPGGERGPREQEERRCGARSSGQPRAALCGGSARSDACANLTALHPSPPPPARPSPRRKLTVSEYRGTVYVGVREYYEKVGGG
jgi:hypothetical protein